MTVVLQKNTTSIGKITENFAVLGQEDLNNAFLDCGNQVYNPFTHPPCLLSQHHAHTVDLFTISRCFR